jgi:hypothetical protein
MESSFFKASQGKNRSQSSTNSVWAIILQDFVFAFDRDTSKKDSHLDRGQVLAEAFVFMSNLKGQLTSVTQYKAGNLIFFNIELIQGSQDKDGCFIVVYTIVDLKKESRRQW